MRDLILKNLTSDDKKRKVLVSNETFEREGLRSTIHRHFICLAKEIKGEKKSSGLTQLFVTKERNSLQQKEKFSCKLKGSIYLACGKRLFLVLYMHSLSISVTPAAQLSPH